ncbi:MAG: chorismate mutase [Alphaproteobacteria bacterium]|nr:chorismate mutase [Alphaproteobacteria bacterium]
MTEPSKSLDELRREIDALDDSIHDALIARSEISLAVRASKGPGGPTFRAGREADVLRRLVARHRGRLPHLVIVQLWREIMSASSRLQGPFTVAVAAGAAGGAALDLARDHFGALTTLQQASSIAQAMNALAEERAILAVVPLPEDVPDEPWWRGFGLGSSRPLNILSRIPITANLRSGAALIVGRQPFDASSADHGFAVVETRDEISQARLRTSLEKAGLRVIGFPAAIDDPGAGSLQLVEFLEAVAPTDPRLAVAAETLGSGSQLRPIGGYAVPLELPRS